MRVRLGAFWSRCTGRGSTLLLWAAMGPAACVQEHAPPDRPKGERGTAPTTVSKATDPLWDPRHHPTFRLSIPVDDWVATLWELVGDPEGEPCAARPYLRGSVDFENPVTGWVEHYEDVGVRYRGHSSVFMLTESERVGLKLSFNEFVPGRRFHDVRKVNLLGTEGDNTYMREHLALLLLRSLGIPAPRSTYAHLYVNEAYQGLFPLSEEQDDEPYVEHHFGDDSGHLYKVEGYCGGRADFSYLGEDPADYVPQFEPKAGTLPEHMTEDLIPLIRCANAPSDARFKACVGGWLDLDGWLLAIAADVALPDVDGMFGAGQNFMLYRKPANGQFVIYPWDKDLAFGPGNVHEGATIFNLHPMWRPDFQSILGSRLVRTYRHEYCAMLLEVAELYRPDVFLTEVHGLMDHLEPRLATDPFVDVDAWQTVANDIEDVIRTWHPQTVQAAEACLESR